jgi:hypothetical protein
MVAEYYASSCAAVECNLQSERTGSNFNPLQLPHLDKHVSTSGIVGNAVVVARTQKQMLASYARVECSKIVGKEMSS